MLGFVIFLVLLFVLLGVAIWYYYTWTPLGVLKDIESQYDSSMLLKDAAERAKYVQAAQEDIKESMAGVDQKFQPLKNFKDRDPMHPECVDVSELCEHCGSEVNVAGACTNMDCVDFL